MDRYFEIQHFLHPEHPLILGDLKDPETRDLIETMKKINREKEISDRLRQGLFVDKHKKLDVSIWCVLCHNEILETSYSCTICDIHLHKLCAKFPAKMIHPNHIGNPLTLTDDRRFRCRICTSIGYGFSYFCHSCNFDVDVKCASRSEAINHQGHPHPLYPVLRTALFKCDACASEHSAAAGGVSYMCNTCNFWVHEDCATLPPTVKYRHHVHPLSLVTRDFSRRSYWRRCAICEGRFQKQWLYECDGCEHEVLVNCLAKTLIAERKKLYEVDADIDMTKIFQLPESFQYDDLVTQLIKHMTIHYGENAESSEVGPLSHFTHKHPLTLIICNGVQSSNINEGGRKREDILCIACAMPVSSPQAYYSCTECNNYALHEWCAKLPNELLQPPAHPHPLILQGPDHKDFGLTECPACKSYGNGFSYRCQRDDTDKCLEFAMDIKCLLPPSILHKAHDHPLKLVQNCIKEGCVACHYQSRALAYGCVSCCFYLHHDCAMKPVTIVHRYDKHHPFISTSVEPVENRVEDEYVCEFCEKHIDPKWWFHHCLHCDLSACSECIFPKYGGRSHFNPHLTYSSNIHDHPLSYVQVDITNKTSLCAACHWDFHCPGYALQCAQCKAMLHIFNCSRASSLTWKLSLVLQE